MSNDTQESPSSRPRFYPSVLTQMQIERLKKEDEDEHWISGEELYTEGSSDDDEDNQRLIIRDSEVLNAENIRSNSIVGVQKPAAIVRSKLSHSGHLQSAQIASCSIELEKKVRIDETGTSAIIPCEEKPSASSSSSSSSSSEEKIITEISQGEEIAAALNDYVDEEKEISWRPKRDDNYGLNLIYEDSIVELRELQLEYREILDYLSELKTSLTQLSCCSNSANLRNRCNNYNEKKENENSDDLLETMPQPQPLQPQFEFQFQLQPISKSLETAPADEEIINEDVSFSDENLSRWSNAIINTAKIEKEIFNITKLDTWIEDLYEKVKKARDETLEEQILNRKELKRLIDLRPPESGKLAKNSEIFFKLFSMDMKTTEGKKKSTTHDIASETHTDYPIIESLNEVENLMNDEGLSTSEDEEESRESRRKKFEEELTIIDKRKASFIERNKKLASCAMGTLAITDEEKNRLKELVGDIDDEDFENFRDQTSISDSSSAGISTPYTIDKEADELLKNLTEQLANLNSESYRKAEEERYSREEFLGHKEQLVINSLRNLEESSSKIIHPISREEMRQLINEYHAEEEANSYRSSIDGIRDDKLSNNLNMETVKNDGSNLALINSETRMISQDVIKDLIIEARTTMPLFQFKYQTTSINELEDEEENNK